MSFAVRRIGEVQNAFLEAVPDAWESAIHRIVIDSHWTKALKGLDGFSHLFVIFWLHGIAGNIAQHVHPENRQDLPAVGLFATRTPRRPNPIGLQVVELVSRRRNVLTVRGLDALNGSPVIDLKPYLPRGDSIADARTPGWIQKLWAGREGAPPDA
jgi:tRNA-Thr(GGU) m(6)t(6)A37 methyltransferase TsaA